MYAYERETETQQLNANEVITHTKKNTEEEKQQQENIKRIVYIEHIAKCMMAKN